MVNLTMWLTKVADSEATKKGYKYTIQRFAKFVKEKFGIDIFTLKETWREAKYGGEAEKEKFLDKLSDIIDAYRVFLANKGVTNMNLRVTLAIISSYLKKGCGIKEIEVDIPKRSYVQYHNRDITREEIRKILDHASPRDRCFFLMMVESGQRPSTLLQLKYKHIKHDFEKGIVPMKIEVPSSILKDRVSDRFTFIGEDGYKVLKEYLSLRKHIDDEDLIFQPERKDKDRNEVLSTAAMSKKFGELVLKLGLDKPTVKGKPKHLRLYCLRKYFFNNMKCDSTFRNFWFGHRSVDDHYISRLDIERHREEYSKGYPHLRIYQPTESEEIRNLKEELEMWKKAYLEQKKKTEELEQLVKQIQSEQREIPITTINLLKHLGLINEARAKEAIIFAMQLAESKGKPESISEMTKIERKHVKRLFESKES